MRAPRTPTLLSCLAVLGTSLACTLSSTAPPAPAPQPVGLWPPSALQRDCLGWPARDFARNRHAEVSARIGPGDRAVDFTLTDTSGEAVHLADLLADAPVLLVQGSWTCPRFQAERAGLEQTAKRFRNDLHVVIVCSVEAHPAGKDPGPYKGRPDPREFSDRGQPDTYAERLRNARDIARDTTIPVLVDGLDGDGANPVWCTYGTCPSCSWLIRRDGTVEAQHTWHDRPSMEASVAALLARGG
ncbi:MAG: hypothetical protein R3F59_21425 [Myxococcota bacterium]